MWSTSLDDDEIKLEATDADGEDSAPEYVFEGYEVDFSEKIAFMPAWAEKKT